MPLYSVRPMPCLIFPSPEHTSPATKHNVSHKWERTKTPKSTEIKVLELFKENWDQENHFVSVSKRSRAQRLRLPPLQGTAPCQLLSTGSGEHRGRPSWSQTKAFTSEGEALMPPPSCSPPCISNIHELYDTDLVTEIMLSFLQFFPSVFAFYSFFSQHLTSLCRQTPYLLP